MAITSFPWVQELCRHKPVICPSLLAADFANLQREIRLVEEAGARVLHVDVMDGHFVPNISIGVPVVASIRKITRLPLDVHLAVPEPEELIGRIRALGAAPGLVLNPKTPAEAVLPYAPLADILLTMSVQPGFGGQKFMPGVLEKVRKFKQVARSDTLLSIDGGIGKWTINEAARAGADMFVAGTSVFDAVNYAERIRLLRRLAAER